MNEKIKKLIELIDHSDEKVRKKAILALGEAGDTTCLYHLIKKAEGENLSDSYYAKKALRILRARLKAEGIEIDTLLKETFLQIELENLFHPLSEKRFKALKFLYKSNKGIDEVKKLLETEKEPAIISLGLKYIATSSGSKALPFIIPFALSENKEIKLAVIEALSLIEIGEVEEHLLPLTEDESPEVAAKAWKVLWQYSKEKARAGFLSMLRSEDVSKKKAAMLALQGIDDIEVAKICEIMTSDDSPEIANLAREISKKQAIKLHKTSSKDEILELLAQPLTQKEKEVRAEKEDLTQKELDAGFDVFIENEMANLNSKNYTIRIQAIENLIKYAPQKSVEILANHLKKEKTRNVKIKILESLESLAEKYDIGKYIELFLSLIQTEDTQVSNLLINLLLKSGCKSVDEIAQKCFESKDPEIVSVGLSILLKSSKEKGAEKIIKHLKSSDSWNIMAALLACEKMKKIEDFETEIAALSENENPQIRKKVARLLNTIDKQKKQLTKKVLDELLNFDDIPSELIEQQFDILKNSDNPEKRVKAVMALGSLGTETIVPELIDCLENEKNNKVVATLLKAIAQLKQKGTFEILVKYLSHEDKRVVANAVEAMEYIKDPIDIEKLKPLLFSEDNRVKANTIKLLYKHIPYEAMLQLELMCKSPDPWVRNSAVYILTQIDTGKSIELLHLLANDHDIDVALNASNAIDELEEKVRLKEKEKEKLKLIEIENLSENYKKRNAESLMSIFMEFMANRNPDIREKAIENFKLFVREGHLDLAKEKLKEITNKFHLATVVKALGETGLPEVLDIINPYLSHEDSRVRANCIEGMYKINSPRIFNIVYPMLNDPDNRTSTNAAFLLWNNCREKVVEKLKAMLKSKKVSDIKSAKYIIDKINQPEAKQLLEELEKSRKEQKPKSVKPYTKTKPTFSYSKVAAVIFVLFIGTFLFIYKDRLFKKTKSDTQMKKEIKKASIKPENSTAKIKASLTDTKTPEVALASKQSIIKVIPANLPQKNIKKDKPNLTKKISGSTSQSQQIVKKTANKTRPMKPLLPIQPGILLSKLNSRDSFINSIYLENITPTPVPENKRNELESAINLYSENKVSDSFNLLKKLLKLYPYDPKVNYYLGIILFDKKKYDEAMKHFQISATCNRKNPDYLFYIGDIFFQKDMLKKALALYLKGLSLRKDDFVVHTKVAQIYMKLDKFKKAIEHFNKSEKIEPTLLAKKGLAYSYFKIGEFSKAEKLYEALKEKLKNSPEPYIGLARIYIKRRNYLKAKDSLEKIELSFPQNPEIAKLLGIIYVKNKLIEDARVKLKFAYQYLPDDPELLMAFAELEIYEKEYGQAINFLKKLLKLKKNNYIARLKLGYVYELKEDLLKALKEYKRILKLNPPEYIKAQAQIKIDEISGRKTTGTLEFSYTPQTSASSEDKTGGRILTPTGGITPSETPIEMLKDPEPIGGGTGLD